MASAPRAFGTRLRLPEGYEAFVPDPLPPEITWTPRLVHVLSDADRAIGQLAGEGRRLPNVWRRFPCRSGWSMSCTTD